MSRGRYLVEWEPGLVAMAVGPVEAPARWYKQLQGKPESTSCWFYDASSPLLACDLVKQTTSDDVPPEVVASLANGL
jgi:hypothetical protein